MRNIIWRNQASAILGIMVILLPFAGVPEFVKNIFFVILGLLIVLFGFTGSRKITAVVESKSASTDSLTEN
jgi:hypothetical protein